jgi:hypothetical protein
MRDRLARQRLSGRAGLVEAAARAQSSTRFGDWVFLLVRPRRHALTEGGRGSRETHLVSARGTLTLTDFGQHRSNNLPIGDACATIGARSVGAI